jgi:hypothetical protein
LKDKLINNQLKLITIFIVVVGIGIIFKNSNAHFPGNFEGYEPEQPIAFSHQLHAGEMTIPCMYCHFGAEDSKHAGIPPANVCMNCHEFVNNNTNENKIAEKMGRNQEVSPEIKKIYESFGTSENNYEDKNPTEWVKVHNLPDFVFFSHKPHINAGLDCEKCHGDVASMTRVKQVNDLSMGWCLDCHRQDHESLDNTKERKSQLQDCATCHY